MAYRRAGVYWGQALLDYAGSLMRNGCIVGRLLWESGAYDLGLRRVLM